VLGADQHRDLIHPIRVELIVSRENDQTMQANRKHDGEHAAMAAAHEGHGGGKTSGRHARHGKHAGHTTGMFRDRFWVSLALSVPVVLFSEMVQMWLGFSMPSTWSGSVPGWTSSTSTAPANRRQSADGLCISVRRTAVMRRPARRRVAPREGVVRGIGALRQRHRDRYRREE
jgi:hypothetical protein